MKLTNIVNDIGRCLSVLFELILLKIKCLLNEVPTVTPELFILEKIFDVCVAGVSETLNMHKRNWKSLKKIKKLNLNPY